MSSTTTVQNNVRTFTNGSSALDAYVCVKITSDGTIALSESNLEPVVGFTTQPVAANEAASISLLYGGGTTFATASKSIDAGDIVYNTTGGKITDASSTTKVGVALESASADGDVIEILAQSYV